MYTKYDAKKRLDLYSREHYNDFIDFLLLRLTIKSTENHISLSPRHRRLLADDDDGKGKDERELCEYLSSQHARHTQT